MAKSTTLIHMYICMSHNINLFDEGSNFYIQEFYLAEEWHVALSSFAETG